MSVTPDTIATALGRAAPDSGPEYDQWDLWIGDARMLIQARLGALAELDQDILDYVVREAVVAQIRRPDDATTVEVRVDDGATSKSYRSSAGRVTIRPEWWALLAPTVSQSAFSITPQGSVSAHLAWCSFSMGATWCSCGVDIAGFPLFESADAE